MNTMRALLVSAAAMVVGCGAEDPKAPVSRVQIERSGGALTVTTGSFVLDVREIDGTRVSQLSFVKGNVFTVKHSLVTGAVRMSDRRMTPDAYRDRFGHKGVSYADLDLDATGQGVSEENRVDLTVAKEAIVLSTDTPTEVDDEAAALADALTKAPLDTKLTPGDVDDQSETEEGGEYVGHASASLCWAKNKASVYSQYDATVCKNWWCKVKTFGRSKWIGGSNCFGRCGKGCDWGWLKQRYTQACANHDVCVEDLGYSDPRCWNEFAPTLVDAVSAKNCG